MDFFRTFLVRSSSALAPQIDSDALLREATAKKAEGNINDAIELLRQFWSAEPFGSSGYGVEAYLKLPMYLQHAGRRDDAWHALDLLMRNFRLTTAKENEQVLPMLQSKIYDKMRLFWQREGEPLAAVKYGVLCHLQWLLGLHRQRRKEEFRECARRETIEAVIEPLLRKAQKLHLKARLCDLTTIEVCRLPTFDVDAFTTAIDQLLLKEQ